MKKRTFTDIQAVRAGIACAAQHFQKADHSAKINAELHDTLY